MEALYLQYQAASIRRYFRTAKMAKVFTALVFVTVLVLVAVGIFFFFRGGFWFINKDEFLKSVVALYAYELFFLMIAVLIFLSALIGSLFALFRDASFDWIMVTPRYRVVPLYVLWRTLEMSLWPMLLIGVPALFAVRSVFGLSLVGLIVSLGAIVILSIFSVLCAVVLLEVVGLILWATGLMLHKRILTMGTMVVGILLVFAFVVLVFKIYAPIDFSLLSQTENLKVPTADLQEVVAHFSLLPTHYPAISLLKLQTNDFANGFVSLIPLALATLVTAILFLVLSHSGYLRLWQALQEGRFVADAGRSRSRTKHSQFPRFAKKPMGVLFEKEALVLYRNTKSALWFCFMLFLWLLQIILNLSFRHNFLKYGVERGEIPLPFQAFQIVIMIYFVSAFVLRFGFPSLSTEKKTVWILGSAPIDMVKVFFAKLAFYAVSFTAIGFVIGIVNAMILTIPIARAALFIILALVALCTVSIMGVSVGALFPNFETDDPEILSTSLPGLGFIAGALGYGALGALAYYNVLAYDSWLLVSLFLILSVFLMYFLPRMAMRKIPQLEFTSLRE